MSTVCKDISALTPMAQKACTAFLSACEAAGLKVRITETYRSQQRQNELYAQGRTKPGTVVTWTKNSRHTNRRAWDICQNIKGKEFDTSAGFFKKCGEIAKGLGITWGGTWKTPDMPHFEIPENWAMPKSFIDTITEEEIDMGELNQVKSELAEIKACLPKVYHYTQDVPIWGRAMLILIMLMWRTANKM